MRPRGIPFSLFLLLPACGGDTAAFEAAKTLPAAKRPTTWDVPAKERLALPEMGPATQGQAAATFVGQTPAGWEEQPSQPARFRDLLWRVAGDAGTECYLTARVGGTVPQNLQRWVGQFGLTEVPAVESLPVVEFGEQAGRLLELHGTFQGKPEQGTLLVFVSGGDGLSTLRFNGPSAVLKAQKDKFLALAKSLRRAGAAAKPSAGAPAGGTSGTGTAPPIDPHQPMPAGHPPTGAGQAPAAPFTATVPAGWTKKQDSSRPLHHTFGSDGEVYVSQMGGSMRAMLDIWRGEVGLPAADDAEFAAVAKQPVLGADGVLLDVQGDFRSMSGKTIAGARLLVGAVAVGNAIVFAKLVGPAADVAAQADGFRTFCESLRRNP
jgi:hypothetical protein